MRLLGGFMLLGKDILSVGGAPFNLLVFLATTLAS
jgi:hypothetical protein